MKERRCFGREVIYSSYTRSELNETTIKEIIKDSFPVHLKNRADIKYLEDVYRGIQQILNKTKDVRPNINNIVLENNAFSFIEFKKSYVFGKPIKYVQLGDVPTEEISILNKYMSLDQKHTKDISLGESLYKCGIAHRIVLPGDTLPFTINNLDSKNTFVVYERAIGNRPLLAVTYYAVKKNGRWFYKGSAYTENYCYDFETNGTVVEKLELPKPHILGKIPITEYYLNESRLGLLEVVLSMLNALNRITSNDMDGIDQFIQSLVVFVNNDVDAEIFKELMALGAVKVKSENPSLPADVKLLINQLDHSNTKTLYDRIYNNFLTIVGMPVRSEKASGGDTGQARELGDGWVMADLRADQDETMFKNGETETLSLVLSICKKDPNCKIKNLNVEDIESKFERNRSDNLLVKAQSLVQLMTAQVPPEIAFSVIGLFSDPHEVYKLALQYFGDDLWKKVDNQTKQQYDDYLDDQTEPSEKE